MKKPTNSSDQPQPNQAPEVPRQGLEATPLTPELLDWARQQFPEEEVLKGLQQVREKGGLELHEFIHELDDTAAEK